MLHTEKDREAKPVSEMEKKRENQKKSLEPRERRILHKEKEEEKEKKKNYKPSRETIS